MPRSLPSSLWNCIRNLKASTTSVGMPPAGHGQNSVLRVRFAFALATRQQPEGLPKAMLQYTSGVAIDPKGPWNESRTKNETNTAHEIAPNNALTTVQRLPLVLDRSNRLHDRADRIEP